MFTFRPGKNGQKNANGGNGANGVKNGNGNGHQVNGHGAANGGVSHTQPSVVVKNGNGNGHHKQAESVIGPDINWKGDLTGAGGLRIEGSFDGNIKLSGPLVIAEGAKVTAETVRAKVVQVAGTVKANIVADKIEILATGRIYGDLTTGAFASEEGAFLRGQITMQDAQSLAAEEPTAERAE